MKKVSKNGASVLSFKTDLNEVLDNNFAAICEAIANKGKVLKELVTLFEKEDGVLDTIIQIMRKAIGEKEVEQFLYEQFGISQVTAHYLLNVSLEDLTSLNAKNLRKMFDNYKENIGKLVI